MAEGEYEIFQYLIRSFPEWDEIDDDGNDALMFVVKNGPKHMALELLKNYKTPRKNDDGEGLLHVFFR